MRVEAIKYCAGNASKIFQVAAPAYYTIRVEIAAINGIQPHNKITDDFSLRTIT
ncbi:MAG TPA: hypothetical protein VEL11_11710 [Candidatus Bathyarchaeia archaeon]|nr:hypothetical protein [Candidatus Bathyarchaeia archaeon]